MAFRYVFAQWELRFGAHAVNMRSATSFDGDDAALPHGKRIKLMPIGSILWPSALALCQALVEEPALVAGKSVLDLGCGAGLCSVLAARLGARVTASDAHPDMEALVAFNAQGNGVYVDYVPMDWDGGTAPGLFDAVIGSDVLYEAQQCNLVLDVLEKTLRPGGVAVLTDPGRPHLKRFVAKAYERGFECDTRDCVVNHTTHPSAEPVLHAHPPVKGPFQVMKLRKT